MRILAGLVAAVLVACSSGQGADLGEMAEAVGDGGAPGYMAPEHDAGAACNPLVPHADASPDGC